MKNIAYLSIGTLLGITLYKSEAASWFRIYEMFNFQAFHMFGIIGVAVVSGIIGVRVIKKKEKNSFYGNPIEIKPKERSVKRYLFGGIIFGLGWALAGSCPGPMFVLVGAGFYSMAIVIVSAMLGTYLYGVLKDKLPH